MEGVKGLGPKRRRALLRAFGGLRGIERAGVDEIAHHFGLHDEFYPAELAALDRLVAALLDRPYSRAQMSYDLRRLRLKGLIHRIPGSHRYTATTYGLKVAFFYSKLYLRILRPNWLALLPEPEDLPRPLRTALDQLDREIQKLHEEAALAA